MTVKNMDKKESITTKEKEFVYNYLAMSQNSTKAYMKTYPNAKTSTAKSQASRMLTKHNVQEAIRKQLKKVWDEKEDAIMQMFNKLVDVSGADIGDYLDEHGDIKVEKFGDLNTFLIDSYSKTISDTKEGQNIRMTIKMTDKLKAISELVKILGMITEKVEVNVNYDKEKVKEIQDIFHGKTE